ncbi:UDP-glucose 4-epimerase [Fontibacillus panacisegetis]|uniref:UDP-glucose 4-epimerase n=1 Tax=Fontibacillus panacisegetis TaxID=670482 RepID=A0A1G7PYA0_9BACL|nr:NAD-dependent epimerase/dehydratase family protein [Fontibacillus panacisegetis]SDF91297.1 UDP-glucose 4-epimerase [Fontibacillus panacisegetis]
MKVLVTGGAGFIGSNVVDRFIDEGHDVVVVDNLSSGKLTNLNPKARFYLLDIRSTELDKVFELEKPDVVDHHAAQKSVPKSVDDPALDAEINVLGLINVLNCCVKHNVKKMIFVSSGGALSGDADQIPTNEEYIPNMISPYAITKFVGEKYLNFYEVTHGLTYVSLRYANVYGPRQIPDGECGVLPIFMNNAIAGKPSRLLTYSDMPRGTTRDYVYIDDITEANVLSLTKGENVVLNIGTGKELYIADLYDTMQEVLGTKLELIVESERVGDVRRSAIDSTMAQKELGWSPKIDLREGIKKTYSYIINHAE